MAPYEPPAALPETEAGDSFISYIAESRLSPLRATGVEILQINVTRRCNLHCRHCHVDAGPGRNEMMTAEIFQQCLRAIDSHAIPTVDITGGAPELNPELSSFLERVVRADRRVIVRSNLLILQEPQYAFYLDLFARLGIEVVGSLPDYRQARAERQRGESTFGPALEIIRALNQRGYGRDGSGLVLDLVHNPSGAYLPAGQMSLEQEYRTHLAAEHGIVFNRLFCLANCPVGRYRDFLVQSGNYEEYMQTLRRAFNPAAAQNAMCRITLSVGWDGRLFDCDFNQMLDLTVNSGAPTHIGDFNIEALANREIVVRDHCFACTAGAGSSCQGALETK